MSQDRARGANAPVILRPLALCDAAFCRALAADPVTRAFSLDPTPPDEAGHAAWLATWIGDRDKQAFIVLWRHMPAALVRLQQVSPHGAEISVAVAPRYRGFGVGTAAIRLVSTVAKTTRDWGLLAYIKPSNTASLRAFTRAGYEYVRETTRHGVPVLEYAWA